MATPVARGSSVRRALMNRFGQDRTAPYYDSPQRVIHFFNSILEDDLAAGEIHRRNETAVRQLRKILLGAADPDELFNLVIVRG